jgi:hypothetical protein|tara:strand:+ start:2037 stop:2300 length:264 start_codon:yes stop_codon:yes gene_type:complete
MPRFHNINGVSVQFTAGEESARDKVEADFATRQEDYVTNRKYKADRRESYLPIGEQLDMLYWDKVNDTELWNEHVAAVKAAHGKPGG